MFWGIVGGWVTYATHAQVLDGVYDRLELTTIVLIVGLATGTAVLMPITLFIGGTLLFLGNVVVSILAANFPEWAWTGGGLNHHIANLVTFLLFVPPAVIWTNKQTRTPA